MSARPLRETGEVCEADLSARAPEVVVSLFAFFWGGVGGGVGEDDAKVTRRVDVGALASGKQFFLEKLNTLKPRVWAALLKAARRRVRG